MRNAMNANAILVAYMIGNVTRVARENLQGRFKKMQRYDYHVYLSTLVAAGLLRDGYQLFMFLR